MSTLGPREWNLIHSDRVWVSEMVTFLERHRNSPVSKNIGEGGNL
jgi:hypothetical protein